jgi:hypothetical protein
MNEERIPKEILNLKLNGKCPKGRLRLGWEEQIRKGIVMCWGCA